MKVIFLKEVPKIGKKYEIKDVNDGYAMNFLLPKKLAEAATAGKVREIEEMKKTVQIEQKIQDDLLMKNLAQISGLELILKEKTSESGHLFKSISKDEIVQKMKKDYHIDISPDCLVLDKNIKSLGEYSVPVQVKDKKTSFKLIIEKE
jgi:large subunit ribosomal protein L9